VPNQGKIQQEDGQSFSTNDTKFRYRTQNNGSPLEHAQVDSNFEIIRLTANGLVDDIKSNYDMVQLNKASIASLENRASELENKTSVNANDIAVNGVKIADNLTKIEVLNLLTAAQGVDLEAHEEAISVNATAILNLDTKTTDNHTALEARVSNNEVSIANLVVSDQANTQNIAQLQNDLIESNESIARIDLSLSTFLGSSITTLEEIDGVFQVLDARLEKFFTTTDNSDGLTIPTITHALDDAAKAIVSNDEDIELLTLAVTQHRDLLIPERADGTNFDRLVNIEGRISDIETWAGQINGLITNLNTNQTNLTTLVNASSKVSALTGTISNGSTIPLPSGYTQAQCKWIVGVGSISSSHGDHNADHNVTFTANSNRVVSTSGIGVGSGTANYLIIGVK